MDRTKANIIAELQRDINRLQGFKPQKQGAEADLGLGPISNAFPNRQFPLGAIHEFHCPSSEIKSATVGFICGLLTKMVRNNSACIWITGNRNIFPPALLLFGIQPDRIIFIQVKNRKDLLWSIEESLKCEGICAVIGEVPELTFTDSRRLQLAVENSRVTGFVLRLTSKKLSTTASISRWHIKPLPSSNPDALPGVGFPRWHVELNKVRNGKPGSWDVEWKSGGFRFHSHIASLPLQQKKKTG